MPKSQRPRRPAPAARGLLGGDVQAALQRAQQMREEMLAAQGELATTTTSGSSGAGKVVATVNGAGDLVELTIDPSVVDPADTALLSDLVIGAFRSATEAMRAVTEERMGPYAAMIQGV